MRKLTPEKMMTHAAEILGKAEEQARIQGIDPQTFRLVMLRIAILAEVMASNIYDARKITNSLLRKAEQFIRDRENDRS